MIFEALFGRKKKAVVLIIDDEPSVRNLLKDALQTENRDIRLMADGASGLKAAQDIKPSLILLDLMMPGMSGYDVLKDLRSRVETKDIPVLILTARNLMGEAEKAFALGAKAYLQKPIELERLRKKVSSLISE